MVKAVLKSDPSRPGWYEPDEVFYNHPAGSGSLRWSARPHHWRPPTDVYELENAVIVRLEIAGMKETDFSITIQERQLIIRGARVDVHERRAYHQMEIRFGEFSSEVELTVSVEVEKASAEYRDGFLTVTLPKARPKQIKITDL